MAWLLRASLLDWEMRDMVAPANLARTMPGDAESFYTRWRPPQLDLATAAQKAVLKPETSSSLFEEIAAYRRGAVEYPTIPPQFDER
jgi:hypothetical protein